MASDLSTELEALEGDAIIQGNNGRFSDRIVFSPNDDFYLRGSRARRLQRPVSVQGSTARREDLPDRNTA